MTAREKLEECGFTQLKLSYQAGMEPIAEMFVLLTSKKTFSVVIDHNLETGRWYARRFVAKHTVRHNAHMRDDDLIAWLEAGEHLNMNVDAP